jgi:uncharacterized protein YukE
MAGGFYGADVDQLRKLAKQFETAADNLNTVTSTLTSSVNQTHAWQGPDASGFRSDWNGTHTSQLKAAIAALHTGSTGLVKNADEQNAASTDAIGGPGGSGGSGGGSGGSGGSGGGGSTGNGSAGGGGGGGGGGGLGDDPNGASAHGFETAGYANSGVTQGDDGSVDARAKAGWQWGAGAEAHGGFEAGPVSGEGSADAFVGVDSNAQAGAGANWDKGLYADASADAMVGGEANANGSVSAFNGAATVQGSANVLAGAEASVNAGATIGPDGIGANAGFDAFAGAQAGVEGSVSAGGVTAGAGAEFSAGIGAHANVDANVTMDEVGVSVDVGAALGIGGGVKFDVSFSPKDAVESVGHLFGF